MYVTHSLEDAFVVGDRLAVIRDGLVEQVGAIGDVLDRPATGDAAEILGIRNLLKAEVHEATAEGLTLDWDGLSLLAPPRPTDPERVIDAYIRPEAVKILYPDRPILDSVRDNVVSAEIIDMRAEPDHRAMRVRLPNGHELVAHLPLHSYLTMRLVPGETIQLSIRKQGIVTLSA